MNVEMTNLIEAIKFDYLKWTSRNHTKELTDVNKMMIAEFNENLTFKEGQKYIKVLSKGSVWGFIVKTTEDKLFKQGDILKAAGYNIMSAEPVEEITILQNALVALNEGAADEKQMAMEALESMLLRKVQTLLEFEKHIERN